MCALLAFFYIEAWDADGVRWRELGPFSTWTECYQAAPDYVRSSMVSECYYVTGRQAAQGNTLPEGGGV